MVIQNLESMPKGYPLLNSASSRTIILPDNRQLGYTEYGSPDGLPVICLHGLPGSRIDFARFDASAKATGARIISIDRPGIGLSSPDPRATMLSIAADIEYLTDALELKKYTVLGGSGGGPYALACAYALPRARLQAVAIVCGPGKRSWSTWFVCKCVNWIPSSVCGWYWQRDPGAQMQLTPEEHFQHLRSQANKNPPHEREVGLFNTDESVRIWLTSSRETFKNGIDATVQDTHRIAADWGFRMEDVRLPVRLWYGKFDSIAPPSQGEDYATRIGNHAQLRVLDETHGSMFANQSITFLVDLTQYLKEASQ